jgi:hypothetical protein
MDATLEFHAAFRSDDSNHSSTPNIVKNATMPLSVWLAESIELSVITPGGSDGGGKEFIGATKIR